MPLYAYRCTQCGHRFEKIQNFTAEPESECPKCHGVLERPLTAPRLNFKGAGWYVNDYASRPSTPKSEAASESRKASRAADAEIADYYVQRKRSQRPSRRARFRHSIRLPPSSSTL